MNMKNHPTFDENKGFRCSRDVGKVIQESLKNHSRIMPYNSHEIYLTLEQVYLMILEFISIIQSGPNDWVIFVRQSGSNDGF